MKKRLTNINPLQLGKVLAALYGCISLIIVPFVVLILLVSDKATHGGVGIVKALVMLIVFPILYATMGFIGGVISGAIYNVLVKLTGGIEFTVEDAPAA